MNKKKFIIIGIGEVLFDILPSKQKMLGGAPANFVYVSTQLGNYGVVLSRLGNDQAGQQILEQLNCKNLLTKNIQVDQKHQTGIVNVTLDDEQPTYEIVEPVAWDFIELEENWREIAQNADAVCFGSLAQRSEIARKTILEFVGLTKGLRVFDVNLRQNYYSAEIFRESFRLANVAKLNQEELQIIAEIFNIKGENNVETAEKLREKFDLQLIGVTRGARGSLIVTANEISQNAGVKIRFGDAIGAGDAFTAALTHGLLRGWSLNIINEFANKTGAFVASQAGAMPDFREFQFTISEFEKVVAE